MPSKFCSAVPANIGSRIAPAGTFNSRVAASDATISATVSIRGTAATGGNHGVATCTTSPPTNSRDTIEAANATSTTRR